MSKVYKSIPLPFQDEQKTIGVKTFRVEKQTGTPRKHTKSPEELAEEMITRAKVKAEQLLLNARLEAEKITTALQEDKQNWEVEKQRLESETKQNAFSKGYEEGRNEATKDAKSLIDQGNNWIAKSEQNYHSHLRDSEKTIVELAISVAEKIISTKLEDEDIFYSFTKAAIEQVKESKHVYVYVHPTHVDELLKMKSELKLILPAETDIYIYANPGLELDSCMLETQNGKLDASVCTQLSQIREKLHEWVEEDGD